MEHLVPLVKPPASENSIAPSLVYLRLLLNVDLKQYKEEIMNAVTEEIDRIAVLEIPEGFAAQALYNLVGPPGTLQ
ncbi:MAG: hypothetical protein QJR02_03795 [Sinobacteraceae bacterium]|nr:hypothetical protein [Nevskia sp.]MDI3258800.1 hypothetical protein [Nevskiaceae bacterium]